METQLSSAQAGKLEAEQSLEAAQVEHTVTIASLAQEGGAAKAAIESNMSAMTGAAAVSHESDLAQLRQEHAVMLSVAEQASSDAQAQLQTVIGEQAAQLQAADERLHAAVEEQTLTRAEADALQDSMTAAAASYESEQTKLHQHRVPEMGRLVDEHASVLGLAEQASQDVRVQLQAMIGDQAAQLEAMMAEQQVAVD
jgi:regulator of replication initiation timing